MKFTLPKKGLVLGSACAMFMFCLPIVYFVIDKFDDWQQTKRDEKIIAAHQLVQEPDFCHTPHGDYTIDLQGKRPYLRSDAFDPVPLQITDYDFDNGKAVTYVGTLNSLQADENDVPQARVMIDVAYTSKKCTITFFNNTCISSACAKPQDGVLQ